jgi:hypothetical protein
MTVSAAFALFGVPITLLALGWAAVLLQERSNRRAATPAKEAAPQEQNGRHTPPAAAQDQSAAEGKGGDASPAPPDRGEGVEPPTVITAAGVATFGPFSARGELRARFQAEVDRLARLAAEAAQAARERREFNQQEWRAVEEVLRESARSPRLGLLLLSAKIDRAAQELGDRFVTEAAKTRARTPPEMMRQLVEIQLLPSEAAQALELFYTVRNQIVHGRDADEVEVARAIDSGTRLLRLLLLTRPEPETPSDSPSARTP